MPRWEKGKSGNPKGREPIPKDIKDLKQLNEAEFKGLFNKYMNTPVKALKTHYQAMELPGKDMLIISVIYMAVKFGDHKRFDFILNRLIGKVKDEVNHNVNLQTQPHEAANSALHFANFKNAIKKDPMMRNGIPEEITHGAKTGTSESGHEPDQRSESEWNQLLEGAGAEREIQRDSRIPASRAGDEPDGESIKDFDGESDSDD